MASCRCHTPKRPDHHGGIETYRGLVGARVNVTSPKRPDHHGGIETVMLVLTLPTTSLPQKDLITTEGLRQYFPNPLGMGKYPPQKDLITTEGLRLYARRSAIFFQLNPQKDLITTEGLRRQWVRRPLGRGRRAPKRPDHHGGIETSNA